MSTSIEEIAIIAGETPTPDHLKEILDATPFATNPTDEIKEAMDLMFETWGNERIEKESLLNEFILNYCAKVNYSTVGLRHALASAVKGQLPPYLTRPGFLRAIGLRERSVSTPDVVSRFRNLLVLAAGQYCYIPPTQTFAKIGQVDDMTGTLVMHSVPEATVYRIQLDQALATFIFFAGNSNVARMIQPAGVSAFTANSWRNTAQQYAVRHLSDSELMEIAQAVYIPKLMNSDTFANWWKSESAAPVATVSKRRAPGDCRNLAELGKIIQEELNENPEYKISESDVEKLTKFFDERRAPDDKELKLVVEVIAILEIATVRPQLKNMLNNYKHRVMFWPAIDAPKVQLENLEIWGTLTAKQLPHLIKTTERIFSVEYLLHFAPLLPLKALNTLFADMELDFIRSAVFNKPQPSSDILLWVWKNRRTIPADMLDILTIDNIIDAIVMLNLPKAWGPAQRELRKLLIEDIQLIKTVIDNADDVHTIIYAVQRAKGFSQPEQQSLLVKLARHSEDLKNILEGGEGQRMMANSIRETQAETVQPLYTSLKSFNAKRAELDHLLNVLIPQNRQAIETARAHGDFRENSEYDVAKADRRYLTSQRNQMEQDLNNAQPIDFKTVNVGESVVVGCSVDVKLSDGETITYHVVGAFDSNPDLNCVAYRTPIGQALMGRKAKSAVELPGKGKATIQAVRALDPNILKLLSE